MADNSVLDPKIASAGGGASKLADGIASQLGAIPFDNIRTTWWAEFAGRSVSMLRNWEQPVMAAIGTVDRTPGNFDKWANRTKTSLDHLLTGRSSKLIQQDARLRSDIFEWIGQENRGKAISPALSSGIDEAILSITSAQENWMLRATNSLDRWAGDNRFQLRLWITDQSYIVSSLQSQIFDSRSDRIDTPYDIGGHVVQAGSIVGKAIDIAAMPGEKVKDAAEYVEKADKAVVWARGLTGIMAVLSSIEPLKNAGELIVSGIERVEGGFMALGMTIGQVSSKLPKPLEKVITDFKVFGALSGIASTMEVVEATMRSDHVYDERVLQQTQQRFPDTEELATGPRTTRWTAEGKDLENSASLYESLPFKETIPAYISNPEGISGWSDAAKSKAKWATWLNLVANWAAYAGEVFVEVPPVAAAMAGLGLVAKGAAIAFNPAPTLSAPSRMLTSTKHFLRDVWGYATFGSGEARKTRNEYEEDYELLEQKIRQEHYRFRSVRNQRYLGTLGSIAGKVQSVFQTTPDSKLTFAAWLSLRNAEDAMLKSSISEDITESASWLAEMADNRDAWAKRTQLKITSQSINDKTKSSMKHDFAVWYKRKDRELETELSETASDPDRAGQHYTRLLDTLFAYPSIASKPPMEWDEAASSSGAENEWIVLRHMATATPGMALTGQAITGKHDTIGAQSASIAEEGQSKPSRTARYLAASSNSFSSTADSSNNANIVPATTPWNVNSSTENGGATTTTIQRKASGEGIFGDDPRQLRSQLTAADTGIVPDYNIRNSLDSYIGFDPENARLHSGAAASTAARELNAEAFTIGSDVFFGEGRYDPSSRQGMGLIAHELAHVGQQTGMIGDRARFFTPAGGDIMEREAQDVASRVLARPDIGVPMIVDEYIRDYVFATDTDISDEDVSRLDHISILALQEAQRLLGDKSAEKIASINVHINLDLSSMTDQEAVRVWAQAIAAAVPDRPAASSSVIPIPQFKIARFSPPGTPPTKDDAATSPQDQAVSLQFGLLTVTNFAQLDSGFKLLELSLTGQLESYVLPDTITRAKGWISEVDAWRPEIEAQSDQPLTPDAIKKARAFLDRETAIDHEITNAKKAILVSQLAAAKNEALLAADKIDQMKSDLAEAQRRAFLSGNSSTIKDIFDQVSLCLDLGIGLHEVAEEIDKSLAGEMAKDFLDLAPQVSKVTEFLASIDKGMAAFGLAYTLLFDSKKRATELEEASSNLNNAVSGFSALTTLIPFVAPHIGLMANLYLGPLTKAITVQLGNLADQLHKNNEGWVEFEGKPLYAGAEVTGSVYDLMKRIMRAGSVSDLPNSIDDTSSKFFLDHRSELEAGTGHAVPVTGLVFHSIDSALIRQYLFNNRGAIWPMLYGRWKPPTPGD